jgi:hypothetical protein
MVAGPSSTKWAAPLRPLVPPPCLRSASACVCIPRGCTPCVPCTCGCPMASLLPQTDLWSRLTLAGKAARVVMCLRRRRELLDAGRPALADTCVQEVAVGLAAAIADLEVDKGAWDGALTE